MLAPQARISHLNLIQWRRLSELAYRSPGRRLTLVHDAGVPAALHDSASGLLPTPSEKVEDPKAAAEALLKAHPGAQAAWVLEPASYAKAMAGLQASLTPQAQQDDYALAQWEALAAAPGCAVAPDHGFFFHGLPLKRIKSFVDKMLPPSCSFVLAVFDGDLLWACLIAQFEDKQLVALQSGDALDQEDLKDVVGRDQHPFLLSMVANTFRRPAFGWFVERPAFEAWMLAPDMESKDEAFQKAIMSQQATFDFSVLVDRHLTAFSPINPGEAAVQGQDRELNPRTRTPDPGEPGPSAL